MSARIAFLMGGAWLIGACTTLDDIQRTRPVYSLQFDGPPRPVAECVYRRVGGKLRNEVDQRFVIYDSVKGQGGEGLSHYAITIGARGADRGYAEWRVAAPPSSGRFGPNTVSQNAVRMYWTPVEDCAKTKGAL